MAIHLTQPRRLQLVIGISLCFFLAEISVGFYTRSLALVADAFHYLNDLIGFIVAYMAIKISAKKDSPQDLSFGWQRSRLLVVDQPKLVVIVGCVGLGLNIISASFLHEHEHSPNPTTHDEDVQQTRNGSDESESPHANHRHNHIQPSKKGHDLGMLGVLIHVLGDAANNVGVIISGLVIWLTNYGGRYYADPATSMAISLVILATSVPLVKRSGKILLESAPQGVNMDDVRHDLEKIPGVSSVHELHIWRLNQEKSLASVHVSLKDQSATGFAQVIKVMNDCFHSYGVHSAIIQPELIPVLASTTSEECDQQPAGATSCQVKCGSFCEVLMCCG